MASKEIIKLPNIIISIAVIMNSAFFYEASAQSLLNELEVSISKCQISVENLQELILNNSSPSNSTTAPTLTPISDSTTAPISVSTSNPTTAPISMSTSNPTTAPISMSTSNPTTAPVSMSTSNPTTALISSDTTTSIPTSTNTTSTSTSSSTPTSASTPTSSSTPTSTITTTGDQTGPAKLDEMEVIDTENLKGSPTQNKWGKLVESVLENMDAILSNITENPFGANPTDLDAKTHQMNALVYLGEKFTPLVTGSDQILLLNSSNLTLVHADEALTVVENANNMSTLTTFSGSTTSSNISSTTSSSTSNTTSSTASTPEMSTLPTFSSSTTSSNISSTTSSSTSSNISSTTSSSTSNTTSSTASTPEATTKTPDSSTTLIIWLVSVLLLCIIICIILVVWKPWKRNGKSRRSIVLPPQQQSQVVFTSQEEVGMRNRGFVKDIEEQQIAPIIIPRAVTIPMSTRNVQSSGSNDRYAPQKSDSKMAPLPSSYKTYT